MSPGLDGAFLRVSNARVVVQAQTYLVVNDESGAYDQGGLSCPPPPPIHPPSHPLPRAQTPNTPLLPRPQIP